MYIVTITNGNIDTVIHGDIEKLKSGKVVKGINTIDSFTFTLLPSNAGFSLINEFTTLVKVYNTNKKKYTFIGRALYAETSMGADGLIEKEVTCESVMGYLCDSQQAYVATQNWTVQGLLQHLINSHNSQVESYKRFTIGEVTASDSNDNVYVGIERENTWEAINSNLIKKIGGELQYRVEDDVIYIDYLEQIGETKATEIALSKNMKSITREKDPTSYITRLIPLGAKLGNDTEERLDITSVNGGLNYIEDEKAVEVYGIHAGYVEFDDVTVAANLLSKGRAWMAENNKVQVKYTITALDLSLLGLVIDDFDIGNSHPIKNALLGIDDTARIIKKSEDIVEEVKSTIDVGDNFKSLSDIQREQAEQAAKAAQNVQKIESITVNLQGEVASTKESLEALQEQFEGTENIDAELADIRQTMTENYTSAINTADQIRFEASQKYVEKTAFEEYQEDTSSRITQTAEEIEVSFTEQITRVEGDLQTQLTTLTEWIRIAGGSMTFGTSESAFTLTIENDLIAFFYNGVRLGWIDPKASSFENVIIPAGGRLQIGETAFVHRSNGAISILQVG